MNEMIYNTLMNDSSITLLCKSWLWMYKTVFSSEVGRNWKQESGEVHYPFYDQAFIIISEPIPDSILLLDATKFDFYSCCEHWFECCAKSEMFTIEYGLANSDGGLGLVVCCDLFYSDLEIGLFGVLEFVNPEMFDFLQRNKYQSLYVTQELDLCVVIGPISLCNNGRTHPHSCYFPQFKDRNLITDEELMYVAFRKEFHALGFPTKYTLVEFEHYALRIHVKHNRFLTCGEQIMVDYGVVTSSVVDLTV